VLSPDPAYYPNPLLFGRCRKTRDELSHNVFLILENVNKFREHQGREILIELLEKQLARRLELIEELQKSIGAADKLL
jgi:hypothetical protein